MDNLKAGPAENDRSPVASSLLTEAANADRELFGVPPGPDLAGATPGESQPAPPLPLSQELSGIFAMIGDGLGQFLPSVKGVLTEEACGNLGRVLAPVAEKYGIAHYFAGFAWRVELHALMVAGPIVFGTIAAVRHDIDVLKAAKGPIADNDEAAASPKTTVAAAPDIPGMLKPIIT